MAMAFENVDDQACPRQSCPLYGQIGKSNIRRRAWIGCRKDIRLLWCTACDHRFSERCRTALAKSRLTEEKFVDIANHITEGCGIRPTGRLCGVAKKTVLRVVRKAGMHGRRFHDVKVWDLHVEAIQIDEKRCAVRGSRLAPVQPPKTKAQAPEIMDDSLKGRKLPTVVRLQKCRWDHTCIATREKLVISAAFGTRTSDLTDYLVSDVRRRIKGGKPPALVESDEFAGTATAVQVIWGEPSRVPRARKFVHGTVRKVREDHRVVKCIRRIVHGDRKLLRKLRRQHPSLPHRLNTSFIERYNRTDRGLVAYKQRLSNHLAQRMTNYDSASWLAITYYNFCRHHRSLRVQIRGRKRPRTPAQAARIANHCWNLREVLAHPIALPQLLPPPELSWRIPKEQAAAVLASQWYPATRASA